MNMPSRLVIRCGMCEALLEANVISWAMSATGDEGGPGVGVEITAFARHSCELTLTEARLEEEAL